MANDETYLSIKLFSAENNSLTIDHINFTSDYFLKLILDVWKKVNPIISSGKILNYNLMKILIYLEYRKGDLTRKHMEDISQLLSVMLNPFFK